MYRIKYTDRIYQQTKSVSALSNSVFEESGLIRRKQQRPTLGTTASRGAETTKEFI